MGEIREEFHWCTDKIPIGKVKNYYRWKNTVKWKKKETEIINKLKSSREKKSGFVVLELVLMSNNKK